MITRLGIIGLLFLTFTFGCKTSKVTAPSYAGEWHYTFASQDGGEIDAVMTIKQEGSEYTGELSSEMGSVAIDDLKITEGELTGSFEIETYVMDLKGTFEGDMFHGTVGIDGMEFPMEAERK